MSALFHLECRRADAVADGDWFVTTITPLSRTEVDRVIGFMNSGVEFVYRAVPVDGGEPVVKLLLDRPAVRVVKAALMVEIATLEFKVREDHPQCTVRRPRC
ncbi:hypothetical protein GTP44_24200 [Duganella sp. FT50W]|uniref:Uncharacterized protein n=1 Tax=Duganella lactea TaxID=2692173 RepID=A0A6L8MSQ8_9BURK|nr:hypothetical protein [Duganella lactea]MYM85036.1 hypothetical protein [Duganella lactea]